MMTKGERKHHSNCGDEITNVIAYWYALASRYVPSFITIVGKQCIYSFLLMTKTGRNVMLGYILNTLSDTPIRMASTWYCVLVSDGIGPLYHWQGYTRTTGTPPGRHAVHSNRRE